MTTYTIYRHKTGRIVEVVHGNKAAAERRLGRGDGLIKGDWDGQRYYVRDGKAVERPAPAHTLSADEVPADGKTRVTLGNLPADTRVALDGRPATVTGGELTLRFDTPGKKRLRIQPPFPYRIGRAVVRATEPADTAAA